MNDYDSTAALHYAAYRPPLHKQILDIYLDAESPLDRGLDIGCGTGQSSLALAKHCCHVHGIDISQDMLDQALPHPKVSYQHFDGEKLPFEDGFFDLLTFAGSLYYAKSQGMLDEVLRVSNAGSKVLVYDFEMMLDPVLTQLGIELSSRPASGYRHEENFSGLRQERLNLGMQEQRLTRVEMAPSDLAHLFLSVKDNYDLIGKHLGRDKLHEKLTDQLESSFGEDIVCEAHLYASLYDVGVKDGS